MAFAFILWAAFRKNACTARQIRDAQAFGGGCRESDFPPSNPTHDPLDARQAFFEWLHVAGSLLGIKLGRQQTSCSDQRHR